jgi:hypothetical protein
MALEVRAELVQCGTAGAVRRGPVASGDSGPCWVEVDYADQLNVPLFW